jgi:hypothetical protein
LASAEPPFQNDDRDERNRHDGKRANGEEIHVAEGDWAQSQGHGRKACRLPSDLNFLQDAGFDNSGQKADRSDLFAQLAI